MTAPSAIWEMIYSHDRRVHRHRCVQCNRIVNAGDRVFMAKTVGKKTKVIHALVCAEATADGISMRERMEAWGRDYLKACGWSDRTIAASSARAI